jgi:tetratricopeptide (TPR) repeat protein
VRYVLEGGVRRAAKRVRISGQLIDAGTGALLWADRFEGGIEDIFDLQDEVTRNVVGAIAPRLEEAEIERAKHKLTESLDAYDCYLRGMAAYHLWTDAANTEARSYFYRAIELDQNFASAYGMAARCYVQCKALHAHRDIDVAEVLRLARHAAALGKDDAVALWTAGFALAYVVGDLDDGAALIDRALTLNSNLTLAWTIDGWTKVWLGKPEAAIESEERAMRLSPHDTESWSMHAAMAYALFFSGRYAEAASWAEMAGRENPSLALAAGVAAASSALADLPEEASKAMARVRQIDPELRLSNLKALFPLRRSEDFTRWAEGMRKAGLPE